MLIFNSCSVFQTSKLKNLDSAAQAVCLNSEGKGKIQIASDIAYFGFYSVLELEEANWLLGMNFPLQEEETFELDWSRNGKISFKTSIEQKILRQNKDVNPIELEEFIQFAGNSLKDIVTLKSKNKNKLALIWGIDQGQMVGTSSRKKAKIIFEEFQGQFYKKMKIELISKKDQVYKLEFNTRICHEKL